jgi:hypothetical protein
MANLLQSSQNKTTCAPSFYTNYLTNLASKGQQAVCNSQYAGAQPLQTEAFCKAQQNFGLSQPAFQAGLGYMGCAANQDITGAALPYVQQAANTNTAQLAQCYMSPYIQTAVHGMSDIANRNIQQNLSPQATAAAVGSGQFGSQRGAQVLGQVQANAMQDLNTQIANMENQGYNQALQAAINKQQILNQAGSTAGTVTAEQARALQQAGLGMGTLGQQQQAANLACVNALATLGGQQQTIAQNAQCYPLSQLTKLSGLLQGAQIPTSVKTTMCMSPFSALGAAGAGALGILCKYPDVLCKVSGGLKKMLPNSGMSAKDIAAAKNGWHMASCGKMLDECCNPVDCTSCGCQTNPCCTACNSCCACDTCVACNCCACLCCTCFAATGGSIRSKGLGAMGCASTRNRGGLPRG